MKDSVAPLVLALMTAGLSGCGSVSTSTTQTPIPVVEGCAVEAVANEGWPHVPEGSAITYRHNPPASGPHYPVWARYEEHATAVPRGYWVHNLEHGALVFLYRPGAPAATIAALRSAYQALPDDPACGRKRAVLTPDPLLPGDTAVVAADFVLQSGCTDGSVIRSMATNHQGHGPEAVCDNGTAP